MMTLRASFLAAAACGSLLAGAGAAAAQSLAQAQAQARIQAEAQAQALAQAQAQLQAGQMMTQAEADRLEALQSDMDRREAENADTERQTAPPRPRTNMHDDYEAAIQLAAAMDREEREAPIRREIERQNELEIAEWEKIEAERLADCHRNMPAEMLMMVDTIRAQYNAAIAQTHDAEARAGLVRTREAAVAGMIDGQCQSGGEARFERERQEQIDRMREGREMPQFVRRADGSIGPPN